MNISYDGANKEGYIRDLSIIADTNDNDYDALFEELHKVSGDYNVDIHTVISDYATVAAARTTDEEKLMYHWGEVQNSIGGVDWILSVRCTMHGPVATATLTQVEDGGYVVTKLNADPGCGEMRKSRLSVHDWSPPNAV